MIILAFGLALGAQEPAQVSPERLAVLEECADRNDLTVACPGIELETALIVTCTEGAATVGVVTGCVTQKLTDCMDTDDNGSFEIDFLLKWCGAKVRAGLSNAVTQSYASYIDKLPAVERGQFTIYFKEYTASINESARAGASDELAVAGRRTGILAKLAFDLAQNTSNGA